MKKLKLFLLLNFFSINVIIAQSGYVGETIYLPAPSVPGTLGGAAWYSVDHDNNLSVSGNTSGGQVTITGYFSGTANVACQYAYHYYVGSTKKYGNGTVYYKITCKSSQATLSKHSVTLKLGQEMELTYTNSSGFDLPFSLWTTSEKNIVNFEGYDKVYGKKTVTLSAINIGESLITFKANTGGEDPTCLVTVIANPPQSISVIPEQVKIREGQTGRFTCSLTPEDAYTNITWSSSNEKVAKVSSSGMITAISSGTATIIAKTDNGLSASGEIEVLPLPQQVSLPNNLNVYVGYTNVLCPQLYPKNASAIFIWTSDNPIIADVDINGKIRGKKPGNAIITVSTDNNKTASCQIIVKEASEGMDSRNTNIKINVLRNIINTSLNYLK